MSTASPGYGEAERRRQRTRTLVDNAATGRASIVPPILAALAVTIGLLLGGFNSALGQIALCILGCGLLGGLLLFDPPASRFWRRLRVPLGLAAAALVWAIIPQLVPLHALSGERLPFAPDLFLPQALSYVGLIAMLIAGAVIGRRREAMETCLDWIVGLCAVELLFGLFLREIRAPGVFEFWTVEQAGRFLGTIGNANVTAAVAGAVALIALSRILSGVVPGAVTSRSSRLRGRIVVQLVFFVVTLGSVSTTASRFALVTALGLAAVFVLIGVARNMRQLRRLLVPAAVLAGMAVLTVVIGGDLFLGRLSLLGRDVLRRTEMWDYYFALAQHSPLFGYGLGSFPSLNEHFLPDVHFAQAFWNANSPHGILLQLWLNGGIPYLLLIVAAGAVMLPPILRRVFRTMDYEMLGAGLAMVQILLSATIDVVLDVPAATALFVFLFGMLWGQSVELPRRSVRQRDRNAG